MIRNILVAGLASRPWRSSLTWIVKQYSVITSLMLSQFQNSRAAALCVRLGAWCVLASVGCVPVAPQPTTAQLVAARASEPELSLEDLQRGRDSYVKRCGSCHALRSPGERAPDAWPLEVQRMQTQHQVRLSPQEQRDIVRYLRAASLSVGS
jgi:mono/diheme cytochrome c family protein